MNQKDMADRLMQNPAALQAVLNSPDGQMLLHMLQGQSGGKGLEQAVSQAAAGDTAQVVRMLKGLMATPDGAQLIQRIGNRLQK